MNHPNKFILAQNHITLYQFFRMEPETEGRGEETATKKKKKGSKKSRTGHHGGKKHHHHHDDDGYVVPHDKRQKEHEVRPKTRKFLVLPVLSCRPPNSDEPPSFHFMALPAPRWIFHPKSTTDLLKNISHNTL
jgi:hypothetical protein